MTLKDKAIEDIDREIRKYEKAKKQLELIPLDKLEEAFPDGTIYSTWGYWWEFTLPMNQAIIQQARDFVKNNFPEWEYQRENQLIWESAKEAGFFIEYRIPIAEHEYIQFQLAFRSTKPGSTCVLNQIGVKEVPVFEAVCSQEAADEFTSVPPSDP